MTIKELTKILQRCCEEESMDELLKAAGIEEDEIAPGDPVKIKFCFNKEDDGVKVKLVRTDVDIEQMNLEELEDFYEDIEDEYYELEADEPIVLDGDEWDEWDERINALEELMKDVKTRIDNFKNKDRQ